MILESARLSIHKRLLSAADKRHAISIAGINAMVESLGAYKVPDLSFIESPEYHPYRSLYRRVDSVLTRLGIDFDRDTLLKKVGIGTIWLKTLDDLIDHGDFESADRAVARFHNPKVNYDDQTAKEPIHFLTEAVKQLVEPERYDQVIGKFVDVYKFVRDSHEKRFSSLSQFLEYREKETMLVTEAGYIGIETNLKNGHKKFKEFLSMANFFGAYFDTLLDVKEDVANSLYSKPSKAEIKDLQLRLLQSTLGLLKFPGVYPEYLQSLYRNLMHVI